MVDMKITVEFSQILGIFSADCVYMFYVRADFTQLTDLILNKCSGSTFALCNNLENFATNIEIVFFT